MKLVSTGVSGLGGHTQLWARFSPPAKVRGAVTKNFHPIPYTGRR